MDSPVIDPLVLREMMLLAAGEDWTGFFEVIWALNARYPEISRSEKIAAAKSVLASLLDDGMVEVAFCARWAEMDFTPIEREQAAPRVLEATSWDDPDQNEAGAFLAFALTPAGKEANRLG